MFKKKNYIIVGLTTFNTEFLRISVPALAKLKTDVFLIIHNGNDAKLITSRYIRQLGYRGPLRIITGDVMRAKINISNTITRIRIKSDWMIFINDIDILAGIDVPTSLNNNFAVMQNMGIITNLLDLLNAVDNPQSFVPNNIKKPNLSITGTLLRTDLMTGLVKSVDMQSDNMLWSELQTYARLKNTNASAIYMDKTQYLTSSTALLGDADAK